MPIFTVLGYELNHNRSVASIILTLSGGGRVTVHFVKNESKIPNNSKVVGNDYLVHFGYSRYPYIVDLLRNEKPVNFDISDSNLNAALIKAGKELNGEG